MNLKGYRLAKKKVKPLGVEMKTRAGQDRGREMACIRGENGETDGWKWRER